MAADDHVLVTFGRRVLVEPVQEGRLRDRGWPDGLRAIVWCAVSVYVLGSVLIIFSGPLRTHLELAVSPDQGGAVPRAAVSLLIFMIIFALALFQTASIRGPWWFRGLGLAVSIGLLGVWGVLGSQSGGSALSLIVTALVLMTLVVLAIVRRRRSFVWWEFPAMVTLDAVVVCSALIAFGLNSRPMGFDFAPLMLQQTLSVLAVLTLPISLVAGTALAEITVNATTWAVRLTTRRARPASSRVIYVFLVAVLVFRLAQCSWEISHLDRITQGWPSMIMTSGYVIIMALLSLLLLWIAADAGSAVDDGGPERIQAGDLPDHLSRYSFGIAVAMTSIQLPLVLLLLLLQAVVGLAPGSALAALPFDSVDVFSSTGLVSVIRLLLAAVLVFVAVRQARRAHGTVAVLLGMIAIMLLPVPLTWLAGGAVPVTPDSDLLNLTATGLSVVLLGWFALRRRLSPFRAAGIGGLLVLSGLFSYRDVISDPLGVLLGFSGAALVLFGLTWGLLTDCDFANRSSARFGAPTRVLLVLANFVLAISILAYISLAREAGSALDLDRIADLGDFVLGTALLAAAFVAVWSSVRGDRAVA